MNRRYQKLRVAGQAMLFTFLVGLSQLSQAALTIPEEPLIIGSGPQPNIFFALDDSGSMDWSVLVSNRALDVHGTDDQADFDWIDQTPNEEIEWRQLCAAYNVLAYDPNVTYRPWVGKDDAGNPFTNVPINAVPFDPYDTSSDTVDVENDECQEGAFQNETNNCGTNDVGFIYVEWNDANGDGRYDAKECIPPQSEVPSDSDYFASIVPVDGEGTLVRVKDLSAAEKQNYANWLAYHRKREHVLKSVVSQLVNDSQAFMGLATLHDNNGVGTPVRDMADSSNKDTLLNNLFRIFSVGGTPLRQMLDNVGRYYNDVDGSDSPSSLGFTEASPILSNSEGGACQQNFTLLMSDGFYNGGNPSGIGNEDGDDNTEFDGGPHADDLSDTLADVAMKYYENDLSTLDDIVPIIEASDGTILDDNQTQHMVTYTVAFGLTGNNLTTPPDHDSSTLPPPWPTSISDDSPETLDDMQHAAFNGRGLFLNAQDPQSLTASLTEAIGDIEKRATASSTSVAINSTVLRSNTLLFQASFDTRDYSGELRAFSLNDDGSLGTLEWEANNNIPLPGNRDIFTTVDKSGTPTAIEFTDGDADLENAVSTGSIAGADIINYIRGDQSNEQQNGGDFRDRDFLLGDIVNSSPISIGRRNFGYSILSGNEGTEYPGFLADKTTQFTDNNGDLFSFIYVGSNDGMLHAFDSRGGGEDFAYVPSVLHDDLNLLTDPAYGHKFFVDATPSAADAYIDTGGGTDWVTVLTGTLGAGGRAVFALDITDPLTFGAGDVMWEFTSNDDNELGFVLHSPQTVRLNNGQWGVIFGNGFNSNSERAQLFILNAEDGTVIEIIDTEVGDSTDSNGLSEPFILDDNGDRIADIIYAGDLQGNMWKFDISSSNPNQWGSAFTGQGSPQPLYTAVDDEGTSNPNDDTNQPITTRPTVVNHPDGGFVVLFGTGKYIENSDNQVPADPQVQTFYGIHDDGDTVSSGRDDLQEQQILAEIDATDDDGNITATARVVSDNTVDYANKDGWFIDLVSPIDGAEGERVIANPLTRFGRVIFNTFAPSPTPCQAGGKSFIMELDAVSGARLENSVFDLNDDGIIDADDFVDQNGNPVPGSGISIPPSIGGTAVISGTGSGGGSGDAGQEYKLTSDVDGGVTRTREATSSTAVGRQSWRQLR